MRPRRSIGAAPSAGAISRARGSAWASAWTARGGPDVSSIHIGPDPREDEIDAVAEYAGQTEDYSCPIGRERRITAEDGPRVESGANRGLPATTRPGVLQ